MHDLHCKKADEMHSPILAKRVYELKETQKGVELMCHEMEKIYSEGMESGEKRGELKAKKEAILSLAEMGIPVNQIAKAVNLSEKDVQKWISYQAQNRRFPSTGTLISKFPEVRFHRTRIFNRQ